MEVSFNPALTVAVPANTGGQRIGVSAVPLEKWYDKLPDCPCQYSANLESERLRWAVSGEILPMVV